MIVVDGVIHNVRSCHASHAWLHNMAQKPMPGLLTITDNVACCDAQYALLIRKPAKSQKDSDSGGLGVTVTDF